MEKDNKEDREKKVTQIKKTDVRDMTTCDATAQMLERHKGMAWRPPLIAR